MKARTFIFAFLLVLLSSPLLIAAVPTGFTETQLVTGLSAPTAMAFAPDGRIFVCQQGGALRVIKNGTLLSTPFLTVTVNASGERGLLGVAFDPNFATNQFIYIYYTATTPAIHNRVSRFTANGDVAVANSELILLELNNLSSATNHNGGALHFGIDGKLYIAVGENANTANSQTLSNLLGKMLRINKDGTIPTDNPFYNTASGQNRAIWTLGLRNPFTFSVQPGPGRILINDVGAGSWEEINDSPIPPPTSFPNPRNYGWPHAEGSSMCTTYLCPIFAYPHSGGTFNGCAITGGTFYNPSVQQFPPEYQGDYFFADFCQNWIKKLELSNNSVTHFGTAVASNPVDLDVGPDGSLYYLTRGGSGSIYKVTYTAGQGPSITTHPTNQTVTEGGSATFTVVASGTAPLSYQWQRNNVDISNATSASYTLTNAQLSDSNALFRCVVTNSFGTVNSNNAQLTVTANNPPVANITAPAHGSLYIAGTTINYSGTGSDPEEGDLVASRFTWWVDLHHDDHAHPHVQPVSGSKTGSFTIPASGETDDNQWYRIYLRVTDSGNLQNTTFVEIFPRKASITLASNPAGLQLRLDGAAVTAPFTFVGIAGMIRSLEAVSPQSFNGNSYNFVSWSDGGARIHNITIPTSNTTYTATFNAVVPTGDGLRGTYYNNKDFTGTTATRIDPVVNLNWGKAAPIAGIAGDTFSVRWTGFVQPQFTETYTFRTVTDDGVRLWVNGVQIINRWINNAGTSTGTITLTGGQKYSIRLEYFENKNRASCVLQWSSPSQVLQVIPQNRLYSQ